MNKIKTGLLFVLIALVAHLDLQAQHSKTNSKISKCLKMANRAQNLFKAQESHESRKSTSTDRAIISKVHYYKYMTNESWDSTAFKNYGNLYSELDPFDLDYYPDFSQSFFKEGLKYAGETALRFNKNTANPNYTLSDSTHYLYDANDKIVEAFDGNNSDYYLNKFEYNAAGQITREISEVYNSGSQVYIDTLYYTYGTDYLLMGNSTNDQDSIAFNNLGQVVAVVFDQTDSSFFSYDATGSLSSIVSYSGPDKEYEATLDYDPDYKTYSYELTEYDNGQFYFKEVRTCIGQNGELDSIKYEDFDSLGVSDGIYYSNVTEDSYGNIVYWEAFDDNGDVVEWYRYEYEDVNTSISEPQPFSQVSLYPNPVSSEMLTISTAEKYSSVSLHNLQGQLIMRTTHSPRSESQISLADLPAGSYLLTLESEEGYKSIQSILKK